MQMVQRFVIKVLISSFTLFLGSCSLDWLRPDPLPWTDIIIKNLKDSAIFVLKFPIQDSLQLKKISSNRLLLNMSPVIKKDMFYIKIISEKSKHQITSGGNGDPQYKLDLSGSFLNGTRDIQLDYYDNENAILTIYPGKNAPDTLKLRYLFSYFMTRQSNDFKLIQNSPDTRCPIQRYLYKFSDLILLKITTILFKKRFP